MNLANAMIEISNRVDTIDKLNCYWFPTTRIAPPAFLLSLPENINPNATYNRGSDAMEIHGFILVSFNDPQSAVKKLAEYCDGSGDRSIIQKVQSGLYEALDSVMVTNIQFDVVTFNENEHLSAEFTFSVIGKGA